MKPRTIIRPTSEAKASTEADKGDVPRAARKVIAGHRDELIAPKNR
ncbi:hypothetical protein LGN20_08235 [Burkholderia cepacia]|nr:hypothetical protein [Burkholderia cepacia]MCA8213891.1 hypothetical protein [Burkholderia cepacia]